MSHAHRVTFEWDDGRTERIDAAPDETLLGAAERAGVALPFGCRTGACATCTAELVAGEIEHRRPPRALKERHLDAGYVLACIAEPRSDCRLRVGANVHASMLENPWK